MIEERNTEKIRQNENANKKIRKKEGKKNTTTRK
jgi:hypothetical protein